MQSKYEVIAIVGEGAYGIVYQCRNKENGELVAIKKFKDLEDDLVKKTMMRELKVLQMLKHDNIVRYKEAFKLKKNLFLVFEYVDKNLLELLQEHSKGLDPSIIKKLIYQLCKAIKYLHDLNIVHRDIKPENLLVDSNLKLKLCDFGFARTIVKSNEKLTDYVATRWYRSPELLITSGYYGPEVDYWAIGCIMGELADGDPLFPGDGELHQLQLIQKVIGKFAAYQYESLDANPTFKGKLSYEVAKPETLERRYMGKLSKSAISFMKALLHPDPKQRLKGDDVFKHAYFENYPDPFPSKPASIPGSVLTNPSSATIAANANSNPSSTPNPVQTVIEKKSKSIQPIISNTTNINIINVNSLDNLPTANHQFANNPNNKRNKNLSPTHMETEKNEKQTINKEKNLVQKNLPNHTNKFLNSKNMILTSYNFNQNMKDNILSMYSSTSFDKNFKTFYKGDPYNFDIDLNFRKKEPKHTNVNSLNHGNNNFNSGSINSTQIIYPVMKKNTFIPNTNVGFTSTERTPPKNKKKTQKNNVVYENFNSTRGMKISNGMMNITKLYTGTGTNNMKDFQLPTINNKQTSLKKLMK